NGPGSDIERTRVCPTVPQAQSTALHVYLTCVVEGYVDSRGAVARAVLLAEDACVVEHSIGTGVGSAEVRNTYRSGTVAVSNEHARRSVVDGPRTRPTRDAIEGVVEQNLTTRPGQRGVVLDDASAVEAEPTAADGSGSIEDRGPGAAVITKGDVGRASHGERASANQ